MLEPLGVLGFVTATIASIIGGLAALGVVFAFGIIAAQLLLTNVESYIVVGGGVLLLGFAGSRWTADIASRYLSYAVAIGIKLFSLYLIIGIGNSLAGQWGVLLASPDATLNPRIYFQILGGALAVHDARLVHPVARRVPLSGRSRSRSPSSPIPGAESEPEPPREALRLLHRVPRRPMAAGPF